MLDLYLFVEDQCKKVYHNVLRVVVRSFVCLFVFLALQSIVVVFSQPSGGL
jgi:hypothetical protein